MVRDPESAVLGPQYTCAVADTNKASVTEPLMVTFNVEAIGEHLSDAASDRGRDDGLYFSLSERILTYIEGLQQVCVKIQRSISAGRPIILQELCCSDGIKRHVIYSSYLNPS